MVQEVAAQVVSMMVSQTAVGPRKLYAVAVAAAVEGAGWNHNREEVVRDHSRGVVRVPRVPFLSLQIDYHEQVVRPRVHPRVRPHYALLHSHRVVYLSRIRPRQLSCPIRLGKAVLRIHDHPCLFRAHVPFVHLCLPIRDDACFARLSYPFDDSS